MDQIQCLEKLKKTVALEYRLMPITQLPRLSEDIEYSKHAGRVGAFIYENYMHYDFTIPLDYRSILVVSYPQPHAEVIVESTGVALMPSGYYPSEIASKTHQSILDDLTLDGIKVKSVHLPLKLLGARSGLTQYGKNNISYARDYGSQHRLVAFYTDIVCETNLWHEALEMEICKDCGLCVQACPYDAIPKDSFLLDPNRCLSFYMDYSDPLPEWSIHSHFNTLVGCTFCQDCCPMNTVQNQKREVLTTITMQCEDDIIAHENYSELSSETQRCLSKLAGEDWYELFRRNFILFTRRV